MREAEPLGAIELLMPTIQSADLWRRQALRRLQWEMLRIKDRHARRAVRTDQQEMITEICAYALLRICRSTLPIQWKFRDEMRPRFGLMRGREFLMKDAYSFDVDQAGARHSYNKMFVAYLRTFARLGLKSIPMRADTGPIGGDLSHEFIILAETGESEVFCHKDYLDFEVPGADVNFDDIAAVQGIVDKWTSLYAATSECTGRQIRHASARSNSRRAASGRAHLTSAQNFAPMKANVTGPDGTEKPVHMGSWDRAVALGAAIIEACHDEAGIKWPEAVAPFDVMVLNLRQGDAACDAACEKLYGELTAAGRDVLYHDTDERPGAKFATADLIGVPWQILIGPKGLAAGQFEVKCRADGTRTMLSPAEVAQRFAP